ncbi:MAG: MCE family protein [Candidatus Dormibacteraeota bacterium]|uniref:MCE family protein n=1 Tax=Candidatus Aeolococcus gillhamiae TaxID=3127015 RepID=A0A934JXR6_9BACT|nr:MCE family protein [Candidatus Dormibacteraeota bacterium]
MDRKRVYLNGGILAVFAVFCALVLEFLAINIGQPNPLASNYSLHAVFRDADGIPTAADVRVSGVGVGKVTAISHDPRSPGFSVVTIQISDTHSVPVYSNGFAKVRPKTLLGEKYVDLTVGSSASGEAIATGGYLPVAETGKDVSNDEIFNSFDATTRAQQQQVLAALDSATKGRAGDIQAILPQLQQVVANLTPVARVYEKDQPQTDQIFVQLNTIMQALADEHTQLAGFLANGNVALGAIAQKDQALVSTLQEASNVATELNTAMNPTIAQQRQALDELASTLASENNLLFDIVGPKCNGHPCGIDTVIAGTLNGQVAYPNDQLNVTSPNGEGVTGRWDSMFSEPGPAGPVAGQTSTGASTCSNPTVPTPNIPAKASGTCTLNIVLSFHCDTIAQTLAGFLAQLPTTGPVTQATIQAACQAATGHTFPALPVSTSGPSVPGMNTTAYLAGLFG